MTPSSVSSPEAEIRRPSGPPSVLLLGFFALSGSAALVQEVGWSELLARALGHGTPAVATVAAVFLAGLALGAAWGGRLAARSRRPLALYGALEVVVGIGAALMAFLLPYLPRAAAVLFAGRLEGLSVLIGSALVAGMVLLPVTTLMGATLPVLARTSARTPREAGRLAGRLNGVNALGGALGILGALMALPRWGTVPTLMTAALVQLAVGGSALLLSRFYSRESDPEDLPVPNTRGSADGVAIPPALLFLAGSASLAAQVAWTRSFSWLLGSSVYTFALVLAATVTGLGAGSLLGAWLAQRSTEPRRLYGRLQAALAVSVALTIALLAGHAPRVAALAARFHDQPLVFQGAGLVLVMLTLAVPTVITGAALPVACRLGAASAGVGRGIGGTFAWLTAGNVAGALLAGLVLPAVIGTRGVLLVATGLFALVAVGVSLRPGRRVLQAAAALLLAAWILPPWDPALMASNPAGLGAAYKAAARATSSTIAQAMRSRGDFLFLEEGADALVTVRQMTGGHTSLQINGRTEASTGHDLPSQVMAAHVPLLYVRNPSRVLVIGLASGVTTGSILTREPESVTVAEIVSGVRRALDSGAFDQVSGRPWEDPRVSIIHADARSVLLQQDTEYDLIASQPSHPWVPGVAGLYTEEFYRLVRRRLSPDGVFGQWVQGYGLTLDDLRQVMRTFIAVFPHAELYEEAVGGGDYFLVGSKVPLADDASVLLTNWTPAVAEDLARISIPSPGALLAHRLLDREGLQAFTGPGEVLRDDRLRLAYSTPLSRWTEGVAHQATVLEAGRRPRLLGLDLAGLPPAAQSQLMADLATAEATRRRDKVFLSLLEADAFDHLATPEISQVVAMVRVGLFRAAYSLLLQVQADESGGAALQLLAGDLAIRLGEIELARVHYETSLAHQPGTPAALAGLGHVFLRTGDTEQAALILEAAVAGDPLLASAWSNLGLARRRTGNPAGAEDAYQRALQINPAMAETWYNLGRLLDARQRRPEAETAYRRGLQAAPGDCDLRRGLAGLVPPAEGQPLLAPCAAQQGVPVS